jgi:hypothetical protein
MSPHPTSLYGIPPAELGRQLAGMRYDALVVVMRAFSEQLKADAHADQGRDRPRLAQWLWNASTDANNVGYDIDHAWKICERFEVG